MIKAICVNLIVAFCFSCIFILVAFLSGYASNSNKYQTELKITFSIFMVIHILVNIFKYRKMGLTYQIIASLIILILYLFLYQIIAGNT